MLAPLFKPKKGPAQAGPFDQDVSLALGHDRRRRFALAHLSTGGKAQDREDHCGSNG